MILPRLLSGECYENVYTLKHPVEGMKEGVLYQESDLKISVIFILSS
jgi:hypothetical protein